MPKVNNVYPTLTTAHRIAIIGEAPGKDEDEQGKPFVGASGRLLNGLLSKANIVREACYIGNVCQVRPPDNVIAEFEWGGPEIQDGIQVLREELLRFRPHLVVCLGATALHLFKEGNVPLKKKRVEGELRFVYPNSIDSWRGSKFIGAPGSPLPGVKCIAAHHPAFCLRAYENTSLLMFDLNRAAKEGTFPELHLPQRVIETSLTIDEIFDRVNKIRASRSTISADIEGYWHGMSCISISTGPEWSFVIPWTREDGLSYWTIDEEMRLLRLLDGLMRDHRVPKIWQNGLYDRWAMQYGYGICVLGNSDDTMLRFWEYQPELPKRLDTQASLLTEEPFWKDDRKSDSLEVKLIYCGKDSAVTYEINNRLTSILKDPRSVAHYRFNHDLLNVLLYIELRGIRYDVVGARQKLKEVKEEIYTWQAKLDTVSGYGIKPGTPKDDIDAMVRKALCFARDHNTPKKGNNDILEEALTRLAKPDLTLADYGFFGTITETSLNIKSPKFNKYLYGPKEEGGLALVGNTRDYLALIKLNKKSPHEALPIAVELGILRTRSQFLEIESDPDGRIRCGYNVVGTDTGRITSYTSPTGSGYNLQTLPDDDKSKPEGHPLRLGMRRLVLADPGHNLFQCDLKGSDGWTIGAHLNALGSPVMLDDLRAGIKPAARICYMLRHGIASLKGKRRDEIVELLREVKKDDWDYFACKIGIWGICYLMGPDTLADNIFEESEGKILLSRKEVEEFRTAVFEGYHIKLWHIATQRKLSQKPVLTSASGSTRRFFGRDREILGVALANEPQANTTYATNLAARRLWMDPENRVADKYIIDSKGNSKHIPFLVEPLHQVHDALIVQARFEDTEFTKRKLNEWFNNTLVIAGQNIVIPFEGNYGPSWGDQSLGKV
jgi:uracil-DNA glycosylase family 4